MIKLDSTIPIHSIGSKLSSYILEEVLFPLSNPQNPIRDNTIHAILDIVINMFSFVPTLLFLNNSNSLSPF